MSDEKEYLQQNESSDEEENLHPSESSDEEENLQPSEASDEEENLQQTESSDEGENLQQNESSEENNKSQMVPSEKEQAEDSRRFRNVFIRPLHAAPRHPILSSPFVRRISAQAFGPKKPKWYKPLASAQLYLFKDIVNYIEIGREDVFRFNEFLEALQDLVPGITRAEVTGILEAMEKDEFEELDFGKFLFLLAYKDQVQNADDKGEVKEALSTQKITNRQSVILSAIAYYVLIASPEEITRYYFANTRRKGTVLHYHMEASRLLGLTEKQMEKKQKEAMQNLGPLFAVTGSPYACPVPFVPRTKKSKIYRQSALRKRSSPTSALPPKKGPTKKYTAKEDKAYYDLHYSRIPMPAYNIPKKKRKELLKRCTVAYKDYITKKSYEAIDEYKDRLKKATAVYNNRSLDTILKKGFPTKEEEEAFVEVFQRYMPLTVSDIESFSLWVKPANYEVKHDQKPLYPAKYAFGSKIP